MESVTLTTEPAPSAPSKQPKPPRQTLRDRVTRFSGTPVTVIKLVILGVLTAMAAFAVPTLVTLKAWPMLAYIVLATIAVDLAFLWPPVRRAIPFKYFVTGAMFLVAFQLVPIVYTTMISFTNYSTGHVIKKNEAIPLILQNSLQQPANGDTYDMRVALKDGTKNEYVLLLTSQSDQKKAYIGTKTGTTRITPANHPVRDSTGVVVSVAGYTTLTTDQVSNLNESDYNFAIPNGGTSFIQAQGTDTAADLQPTLKYDAKRDVMIDTTNGVIYHDDGRGYFANDKQTPRELLPGWHVWVGFENYTSLVTNPAIRSDFVRVFLWNIVFAFSSVVSTFALGLGLALVLLKPLRGKRIYRSMMVLPYAIPGFLSILIWAGLLNDRFGPINAVLGKFAHFYDTFLSWFGIHAVHTFAVPWLTNPWWARVSVLLVNLWLGFPYMFLVTTGALTSIPADLTEAASVDGATSRQVFRKITLPLLFVAVGPLLVASFAFNFNNFSMIYLLTGGGPIVDPKSVAGATDILISYTYKLAFVGGKGQQYGLASAVSILIFLMVAGVSLIAFRRTRVLEDTNR